MTWVFVCACVRIGVSDAIDRGYLRSVSFIIATEDAHEVVEEYKFNIKYGARGEIAIEGVEHTQKGGGASAATSERRNMAARIERLSDAKYVKKAAVSMTRCLVSLVQTLEAVPERCSFSMDLAYVSGTPADYQPPFFEATNGGKEQAWGKTPFAMSVGKVETQYHALSLRVKSALDPAVEGDSDETGKATGGSSQTSEEPMLSPPREKAPTHMSQEFIEQLSQRTPAKNAPSRTLVEIDDERMDAVVLDWISSQKSTTFIDQVSCSKALRTYPFNAINDTFNRLLARGVIAKSKSSASLESGGFSLVGAANAPSKALQPIVQNDMRKRLRSAKK